MHVKVGWWTNLQVFAGYGELCLYWKLGRFDKPVVLCISRLAHLLFNALPCFFLISRHSSLLQKHHFLIHLLLYHRVPYFFWFLVNPYMIQIKRTHLDTSSLVNSTRTSIISGSLLMIAGSFVDNKLVKPRHDSLLAIFWFMLWLYTFDKCSIIHKKAWVCLCTHFLDPTI